MARVGSAGDAETVRFWNGDGTPLGDPIPGNQRHYGPDRPSGAMVQAALR
ncbi:hypothetical protein [Halomicronema hongdechloris]|nr:hypothetical protein [Halomicronema hongdechloris]